MKTSKHLFSNKSLIVCCAFVLLFNLPIAVFSTNTLLVAKADTTKFTEYKGLVVDKKTGNPLSFASLSLGGTNISTVTNVDGEFSLKIANDILDAKVNISYIGYKNKTISTADLKVEKTRIELEPTAVALPEISVVSKDANELMKAVFDKKRLNYSNEQQYMTAFYRETIKKNRTYVSLSEAVVEINKQPYDSYKSDIVKLHKSRKKADYTKLDTVTFKLMGGPFNSLYLDIMKNTEMIFTDKMFENYEFTFDRSTKMDNLLIYVIDFKQIRADQEPLYYGKLFIDANSLALKTAIFNLNVSDKELAGKMFIMKKPLNSNVYPTIASYRMDYKESNGKWVYGYSRIELGLKINWKKKLFNTNYYSTIEMAVTDWSENGEIQPISSKERLKPSIIIGDEASGFSDHTFWGEYNVIEPEKSIESAIKKIQKQIEK